MQRRWLDLLWALALSVAATVVAPVMSAEWAWIVAPIACVVSALAGRRMGSLRLALIAFAAGIGAGLVLSVIGHGSNFGSAWITTLLLTLAVVVLPWWLGRYRRLRVEQAEHERQAVARQARLRERARIATDMHDSLGHQLALIALRSGALELSPGADEKQRAAAAELRASAVAATERLHEIIGVLRDDAQPAPDRPSGESIDDLVRGSRQSGVDVRLRRNPAAVPARQWSQAAGQAAHRVVQEAITNATKYAPGSAIEVFLDDSAEPAVLEINNTPPPEGSRPLPTGSGQGLTALDERLRLIGGTLAAGPRGGGFAVRASIPRQARAGFDAERSLTSPAPVLRRVRQRSRKRIAQAAALPVALAAALAAVLIAAQVVTVQQTALHPDDYARLQLGQTRTQIAALLPPDSQSGPTPTLIEPPAPKDSSCEFYLARVHVFDFSSDMYRLCFVNAVLVSKDRLKPRSSR